MGELNLGKRNFKKEKASANTELKGGDIVRNLLAKFGNLSNGNIEVQW